MQKQAEIIWPCNKGDHKVCFSKEVKAQLRWHSILRRQAWMTVCDARNKIIDRCLGTCARNRMLNISKDREVVSYRLSPMLGLFRRVDAMDLMFQTWFRWSRWHQQERKVKGIIHHNIKKWERDMATAIEAARRGRDPRRMWRLMRELGGTGRRERKRNVRDVRRVDPSPRDWSAAMAKPGGEGGCEADTICMLDEGMRYDRREVLTVDSMGATCDGPLFADGELLDTVKGMKYKRCVPEGRARKELYQMMLEADPMIDKFYTCTMNAAYTSSRVLGTWELAGAA